MMVIEESLASEHYAEHVDKPFYGELVSYITSGPVVAMALEGESAVEIVRKVMGATNAGTGRPRHHPRRFRGGHHREPGARFRLAGQRRPGTGALLSSSMLKCYIE